MPYVQSVNVEQVMRLAQIEKQLSPLGIDVSNWSLIPNGDYEFNDGNGGDAGLSFNLAMDGPFLDKFFQNDLTVRRLVLASDKNS